MQMSDMVHLKMSKPQYVINSAVSHMCTAPSPLLGVLTVQDKERKQARCALERFANTYGKDVRFQH